MQSRRQRLFSAGAMLALGATSSQARTSTPPSSDAAGKVAATLDKFFKN